MKSMRFLAVALILMIVGNVSFAHPNHRHKKINKVQYNQHHRINHGVRSGQLTHREAAGLRMQQAKVRHYKQMAMADGRITHAERKLIKNTQYKANRSIYNQKHDRQVRYR